MEVEIIPGTEDAILLFPTHVHFGAEVSLPDSYLCYGHTARGPCQVSGPHPHWVHFDEVELIDIPFNMRPAVKVGKQIIFADGAGRKLTWRERWAWSRRKLHEVSRGNAKIVVL